MTIKDNEVFLARNFEIEDGILELKHTFKKDMSETLSQGMI